MHDCNLNWCVEEHGVCVEAPEGAGAALSGSAVVCDPNDPSTWPNDPSLYTNTYGGPVTDQDLSHYSTSILAATGSTTNWFVRLSLLSLVMVGLIVVSQRYRRRRSSLQTVNL